MGPPGHKGLPGSKGDEGRRGRKGARGMTGKIGLQGRHGSPGLPGKNGQKGERGDRGFQGNGSNCSCPKGDKGDKGVRGLIGFTGYKGDKGDHGNKGNKGYGERGFPGFQGIPGPKGERGEKGEKGDAMDNWRMATAVPSVTYRGERTPSSTKEMMTSTTSTTTTPTTMTTPTTTTPPTTTTMAPPTLAPRRRECRIKMIGIPLLLRQAGPASGAWMTDPDSSPKRWVSNNEYANILYEYRSETTFKENRVDNTYDLSFFHYHGYDHVIRHGSFYFQWAGRNIVVKYDLKEAIVSSAAEIDGASHNTSRYLYKNGTTYFDIEYDENGLWVIYSKLSDDKNIFVVKLNTNTMEAIRIWTINIAPGSYGNGIIVCGVLYLIRDTVNVQTVIDYAYDLYTDEVVPLGKDIKFRNPFGASSMVSYVPNIRHPQNSRINSWDNGRQLSFQLLFV
ncbi:gliomedin-like [Ylistrum balloti]|uniref:gliomedin-like n=1 Tax=Ylistrum balloti TaxID=509963 RepID=UPI002905C4E0|nr:gliomedin-like [Ylistrum balloti]